ncbi:hypothetical protein JX266_012627 [Neoarthrinium moseri]|nr:hypothetical protein JX266_012627 [Neoarthrinium moseri]
MHPTEASSYEAYFYSAEDSSSNQRSPPCSSQGQGMSRGFSSDSHSSASTYGNVSPATPGLTEGMSSYYYSSYGNTNMSAEDSYYLESSEYSAEYSEYQSPEGSNTWCATNDYTTPTGYYSQDCNYQDQSTSYVVSSDPATMTYVTAGDEVPRTPTTSGLATGCEPPSGYHVCLVSGCDTQIMFKRKADLQRHYEHKHKPDNQKDQFFCDYSKCQRSSEAFHRMDHFRDHYRDFHNEDLPRKNGEKSDWYQNRKGKVSKNWWRCTKCLRRIRIDEHGWDCTSCNSHCDTARRNIRGYA